ncbi:uncharacterized protein LOC127130403 [Lathyrus oleraceus]|uniref:uncharacterized protein LOC127130403 n=1 Tax=Pisum sativum TaxID=3888 RepID=UPI0021D2349E|nr:uncharacterized protein LOC127130403 [Pisum sativum]
MAGMEFNNIILRGGKPGERQNKILQRLQTREILVTRFLQPNVLLFFVFVSDKLTHHYVTRANHQRRMDHLEQEKQELKEEVPRLTALMESVIAAQNQPSPTPATPHQRTVISEVVSTSVPVIPSIQSTPAMRTRFPWGMPPNFMLEVPVQQQQQQQCTHNNHNYNNNQHNNFERKKGEPSHDMENFYQLKYEVHKLIKSVMVSFEDRAPNVKANPLPVHGNSSVDMVYRCPGNFRVFGVRRIQRSLVEMHRTICFVSDCEHDHDGCVIYSVNPRGCMIVKSDIQKLIDEGVIQIIHPRDMGNDVNVIVPGPVPYAFDKVVPYKYNATIIENGQEVHLPAANSVVSVPYVVKVTHNGRVFGPVPPKVVEDVVKSEFNILEQLLQTPSKISVLSLLMNSEAHREALQKVLEQAYGEQDVTVDQFDHIIASITSCNNLSFCDEELHGEDKNHNLSLHISINCKEDSLSNVLVDTGSSLNLLPKSTLARLSYQGAPMRYNSVVVKAFDGSRKNVIGEVNLLVKIGPSEFQITFQVMDIHPTYNCLLGRTWIHEAGDVTSTLHQKLKFVKNGKLVVVGGEKALLASHLSSFSYVKVEEELRTLFQALSIVDEVQNTGASMSYLKDAKEVVQVGGIDKWGRVV